MLLWNWLVIYTWDATNVSERHVNSEKHKSYLSEAWRLNESEYIYESYNQIAIRELCGFIDKSSAIQACIFLSMKAHTKGSVYMYGFRFVFP